ncbi:MAG TPA: hypothetical protein VNQ76_14100 [Planctomicrobium sp.]|nr:hypothetical protein [Planctomicrobium sp.]
MTLLQNQMNTDSRQIFADWGTSVRLEEVHPHYDPGTGRVDEQVFSTPLTAIRQQEKPENLTATSATLSLTRRWYLVQEKDVPPGVVLTSARLVEDEIPYAIRNVSESQVPGVLLLECVQGDQQK